MEVGEEGAEGGGLGCDGSVVLVVFENLARGWVWRFGVGELRLAVAWHVVDEGAVVFGE